jgi:hypothetical protein
MRLITTRLLAILAPAALLAALPSLSGCTQVECGDGTIEVDGVCQIGDGFDPDNPICGPGTHLESGECVPNIDPPAVCGPNTNPEVQPDGTILCVGTGGGGCGSISCGSPAGSNMSLCGQLYDVETGAIIRQVDPPPTGQPCDEANPTADGPCALSVEFYDPLAFAANPAGTSPLNADTKLINDCGHFIGVNVTRPFNGFAAVAIEDCTDMDCGDDVRLTGIAFPVEAGEVRRDLRAFAIRRTTDEIWTSSAGDPFAGGASFVDKGVYGPVFNHEGVPVEGVVITAGGATRPADDYYFSDTDPTLRTTVDTDLSSTGPNGMGLMVNSSLGNHSGVGGEPDGCEWQSELATSIATVLFFRESFTHAIGSPEESCAE